MTARPLSAGEQLGGPFLALLAVATLALIGAAQHAPAGRPATATRGAVDTTTLVCPDPASGGAHTTTMTVADARGALRPSDPADAVVSYVALGAGARAPVHLDPRPASVVTASTGGSAVAVTASGRAAGSVAVDEHELVAQGARQSLRATSCLAPGTDWWITGPDGRVGYADVLLLANPGDGPANVTVTAWSANGAFTPPRLASYALPAASAASLPVADYAPDAGLLTFHVHANTGRVIAQAVDDRYSGLAFAGSDWIPPTQPPATRLVVPGFPGGPGYRDLLVCVPGAEDATVSLRLSTSSGSYVPSGHQTLHVAAGHSAVVDLEGALARVPGAVVLSSDVPVAAAAVSQVPVHGLSDLQWQPAAAPLPGPSVLPSNAVPSGASAQLMLTAPAAAARVRVSSPYAASRLLTVPAAGTLVVLASALFPSSPAAAGPLVLTPVDGGRVYASRTLFASGPHATLLSAQQPTALPGPVLVPAAVEDLGAAVR